VRSIGHAKGLDERGLCTVQKRSIGLSTSPRHEANRTQASQHQCISLRLGNLGGEMGRLERVHSAVEDQRRDQTSREPLELNGLHESLIAVGHRKRRAKAYACRGERLRSATRAVHGQGVVGVWRTPQEADVVQRRRERQRRCVWGSEAARGRARSKEVLAGQDIVSEGHVDGEHGSARERPGDSAA